MRIFNKYVSICLSVLLLTGTSSDFANSKVVNNYDALASATNSSANASTTTSSDVSTSSVSPPSAEDHSTNATVTTPKVLQPKTEIQNWAGEALTWANQSRILLGDGKGSYFPDRPVNQSELSIFIAKFKGEQQLPAYDKNAKVLTRSEVATYMVNALKLNEVETHTLPYTDMAEADPQVVTAFSTLLQANIISGYPDLSLKPNKTITRAETAVMLYNTRHIRNVNTTSKGTLANVLITKGGVHLENQVIEGNLYITAGVGSNEVYLKNLEVKGNLIVEGGGTNSVYIENSKISNLVLNRVEAPVRVVVTGQSVVTSAEILRPAILKVEETTRLNGLVIDPKVQSVTVNETTYANPSTLKFVPVNDSKLQVSTYDTPRNYNQATKYVNSNTSTTSAPSVSGTTSSGNAASGSGGGSNNNSGASKPSQPDNNTIQSDYILTNKVKWLQIEGSHYLVLMLKQQAGNLSIALDGVKAAYSPVNAEQTIIKIECAKAPEKISLNRDNAKVEVFTLAQLLNPTVSTAFTQKDLSIQNKLVFNKNKQTIDGEITLQLPTNRNASFKTDVISGATPKGNTSYYYMDGLPQGVKLNATLSDDHKVLSIKLVGTVTTTDKQNSLALTLKMLSKAIQGVVADFTQLDHALTLVYENGTPTKPSTETMSKLLNIEGVNYLVIQLTEPWQSSYSLKVNNNTVEPSFVNQEKTIIKVELTELSVKQLSLIVNGQETQLTLPIK